MHLGTFLRWHQVYELFSRGVYQKICGALQDLNCVNFLLICFIKLIIHYLRFLQLSRNSFPKARTVDNRIQLLRRQLLVVRVHRSGLVGRALVVALPVLGGHVAVGYWVHFGAALVTESKLLLVISRFILVLICLIIFVGDVLVINNGCLSYILCVVD